MKVTLLIIDPQKDFCSEDGALYVPGADKDMIRLSKMIQRLEEQITEIIVSLDTHQPVDISHPLWFYDKEGVCPEPFTVITARDLVTGKWKTDKSRYERTLKYLSKLNSKGRCHTIWPEHCLVGSEGHQVVPEVLEAIYDWSRRVKKNAWFISKGMNEYTEHYSALEAEVPDPYDEDTQLNEDLVGELSISDMVLIAGEASSHCLGETLRGLLELDIKENLYLLTDATSPVKGCEREHKKLLEEMTEQGVQLTTTVEVLQKWI